MVQAMSFPKGVARPAMRALGILKDALAAQGKRLTG
jgi:hypothetical protein